ncbi:MAG: penicillin-binding protein 2 [Armatimonadota bacterium]
MASRQRGLVKKRTTWLFLLFSLLYVAVAGRLVYLQVIKRDYYKAKAERVRERTYPVRATRGTIYDRNGRALAVNIDTASVFANTRDIRDISKTSVRVAALLDQDTNVIEEKLNGTRHFVWLGRQLDARIGDRIWNERNKLPGVGMQRDTKRIYPAGALAAQIVGFTNYENQGAEGLERVLNSQLQGKNGKFTAELDSERRVIPETRHVLKNAEDGRDVYLTIDMTIQHITEQALAELAEKYHPRSACAVVMDPRTGEILAIANYPTYDPNNARKTKSALWRNRAVADLYEPGSTLKTVTAAAALNEGISPYQVIAHCTGREKIAGGRVSCTLHHPFQNGHGGVDMLKMIQQSCNIGAAHLALRLGAKKLYSYEKAFGLLDKPHAGFGCEAVGYMDKPDQWRPIRLANIGFGQGMAVTPLQMTGVYATIANGGVRVEPQIVREIKNRDGTTFRAFKPGKATRVISKDAAMSTMRLLKSCVDVGTGKPGKIDGRTVAGKTGSAQVAKENGRGYENGTFIASFMGFAPVMSPRLVIAVVVNRPQGSHWGATVAAPVFREIGEKSLWYLKVPSDTPSNEEMRRQENERKRLADRSIKGFAG